MTLHTAAVGGNMNQHNLAPFSVWSSVQKYVTGDLVVYSTQIWQASTNSLGNTPTSTSTGWTSVLSGGGGGSAAGSTGEFQYNSGGAFAASANLVQSSQTAPATVVMADTTPHDVAQYMADQEGGAGFVVAGTATNGRGGRLAIMTNSATAAPPRLWFETFRGTLGTPTHVNTGDNLGQIQWEAYDSGGTDTFGTIQVISRVDGDVATQGRMSVISDSIILAAGAAASGSDPGSGGIAVGVSSTAELRVTSSFIRMNSLTISVPNLPTTNPGGTRLLWVSSGVLAVT